MRRYGQSFRLGPDAVGQDRRSWVHVLRSGRWWDPRYEWFELTGGTLEAMVANFHHERARGVEFHADFDHGIPLADGTGNAIAAGDILELQVRPGEGLDERGEPRLDLWALVEWTDRAAQAITAREYNHTSAWFGDRWTNNEGEELGPTLLGFAITNNPVIHGMTPLALNRQGARTASAADGFVMCAEDQPGANGSDGSHGEDGETMAAEANTGQSKLTYLLGKLGLAPSATEADAAAKVTELQGQVTTLTTEKATVAAERDRVKTAREASDKLLADIRTVFGFGEKADVLAGCRTLAQRAKDAEKAGTETAAVAMVDKALREGRLLPAEKEYALANLKREAAEVKKLDDAPTAEWLAARTADPRLKRSAEGGTAATAISDDEDKAVEQLAAKHLQDDADLIEMSKTNRGRALLRADERALRDLAARNRETAGAGA